MTNPNPITANAAAKPAALDTTSKADPAVAGPAGRSFRPDFSGRRLRLSATPIKGFHLCWVNDTGANVEDYLQQGYEFVTRKEQGMPEISRGGDTGQHVRTHVGAQPDGSPMHAYLMKISDLLFEEGMRSIDLANKRVKDSLDRTLKRAQGLGDSKDEAAFYQKGGNISQEDKKGKFQP